MDSRADRLPRCCPDPAPTSNLTAARSRTPGNPAAFPNKTAGSSQIPYCCHQVVPEYAPGGGRIGTEPVETIRADPVDIHGPYAEVAPELPGSWWRRLKTEIPIAPFLITDHPGAQWESMAGIGDRKIAARQRFKPWFLRCFEWLAGAGLTGFIATMKYLCVTAFW